MSKTLPLIAAIILAFSQMAFGQSEPVTSDTADFRFVFDGFDCGSNEALFTVQIRNQDTNSYFAAAGFMPFQFVPEVTDSGYIKQTFFQGIFPVEPTLEDNGSIYTFFFNEFLKRNNVPADNQWHDVVQLAFIVNNFNDPYVIDIFTEAEGRFPFFDLSEDESTDTNSFPAVILDEVMDFNGSSFTLSTICNLPPDVRDPENPGNDADFFTKDIVVNSMNTFCFNVLNQPGDNTTNNTFSEFVLPANPTLGSVTVADDTCITYTSNALGGTDTVAFSICDDGGNCDTMSIVFEIESDNKRPVAVNDSVSIFNNVVDTFDVLANDYDTNSINVLTVSIVSQGITGTAAVVNNQIEYSPQNDFRGEVTVEYEVCDNAPQPLCDSALLVIDVQEPIDTISIRFANEQINCVNDRFFVDIEIENPSNEKYVLSTLLGRFNFNSSVIANPTIDQVQRTCANGFDDELFFQNGSWTYRAVYFPCTDTLQNQSGWVTVARLSFDIVGYNSGATTDLVWSVCRDGANPCTEISEFETSSSQPLLYIREHINLSANPFDACNFAPVVIEDVYSFEIKPNDSTEFCVPTFNAIGDKDTNNVIQEPFIVANNTDIGAVTLTDDLCFKYVANDSIYRDSFTFAICDGTNLCDTVEVKINVSLGNFPPTSPTGTNLSASFTEDEVLTYCFPTLVDNEGDAFAIESIQQNAQNGQVAIISDSCISYTPNLNFNGIDSALFVICDEKDSCDTFSLTLNGIAVNDAPQVLDENNNPTERILFQVVDNGGNTEICLNVFDAEQDEVDVVSFIGNGLTPNGFADPFTLNTNDTCFGYNPNEGYKGLDSIQVVVADTANPRGTDTVSVVFDVINQVKIEGGNNGNGDTAVSVIFSSINQFCFNLQTDDPSLTVTTSASKLGNQVIAQNPNCIEYRASNQIGFDTVQVKICNEATCDSATIFVEVLPGNLRIAVRAFLEGTYDDNSNMRKDLNTCGVIPLSQPFSGAPWFYNGNESVNSIGNDIVDWILIEGRNARSKDSVVFRQAGLLHQDGSIIPVAGITFDMPFEFGDSIYVVVRHRNHIPIMSAEPYTAYTNSILLTDFTSQQSFIRQSSLGQTDIDGVFALPSGNAEQINGSNSNGAETDVNSSDLAKIAARFNFSGMYYQADVNMDCDVSALDYIFWVTNFGKSSAIDNE